MKLNFSLVIIILLAFQPITLQSTITSKTQQPYYEWAIVGAGLAGIIALAVLLDSGIDSSTIAWVDPEFNVGRVGKYYRNVPGNISISRILLFIDNCPFLKNINSTALATLSSYNLEEYHFLHVIVDPLVDFTNYLRTQVTSIQSSVTALTHHIDDYWALESPDGTINAQKVILAIGAQPKRLKYDIPEILLDDALDTQKLANFVSPDDCVAVFGGMHSAILMLKYLSICSVKQIVNFYLEPYFYGAPGLEGETAKWAQEVLEQNPPSNLIRLVNTSENRATWLPQCTKAIYAIGYEQTPILINGTTKITFDEHTGMIDHNVYGIGIAFPPTGIINGQVVAKNGLHAYLNYAKKLIPQWITNKKPCHTTMCPENRTYDIPWI